MEVLPRKYIPMSLRPAVPEKRTQVVYAIGD